MNTDLNDIPVMRAGCRLVHASSKYGFIGVLATTPQHEVVALSALTVVGDGEHGQVPLGTHRALLGPARPIAGGGEFDSPVSALISAIPVSHSVIVRPEFNFFEAAGSPIDLEDDESLFIVREGAAEALGRLSATHATIYRRHLNQRQVYYGATEVALANASTLGQGDAGAAVTCRNGRLYGLVVGRRGNSALVAPLAPAFEAAQLEALTPLEASRHLEFVQKIHHENILARMIATEQEPMPQRVTAAALPPQKSSEELLEESGVLEFTA